MGTTYTRYVAGLEIAGVRLVAKTGRTVGVNAVWACQCLGCGKVCERSTIALNNAAKKVRAHGGPPAGCKQCAIASLSGSLRATYRARRAEMVAAFLAGETVVELADRYGVSKQRVQQVVSQGVGSEVVTDLLKRLAAERPGAMAEAVATLTLGTRRRLLMRVLGPVASRKAHGPCPPGHGDSPSTGQEVQA